MFMKELSSIIKDAIKKDFNHEFLSDKEDVKVTIKNNVIQISDLIDSTDVNCCEYNEDDSDVSEHDYQDNEQLNQNRFVSDVEQFVYNVLKINDVNPGIYSINL